MTKPTLAEAIAYIDATVMDGDDWDWERLLAAWAVVKDAAERCERYERALPRTADGVVVVPGMMLYGFDTHAYGRRVPTGDAMITWADMTDVDEVVEVGCCTTNPTRSFKDWYADSGKAETARQAWLSAPAGGREG